MRVIAGHFCETEAHFCGCGSRARITKTNRLSQNCADIYCQCTNADCGHQFVAFSHYHSPLSPSTKTTDELASALIKSLTPERRKDLHNQLSLF
ncbi:ogr/Delta-like zinc finger family protein [Salinivibrio siamensis]|uniref:ogr/Delta-like zinc finger family protein n=1 Tax=Salinivibrio siamensis TaxID=414286 RepID=UPI002E116920